MSLTSLAHRALPWMSEPKAPRCFAPQDLLSYWQEHGVKASKPTLHQVLQSWQKGGLVEKVNHGLYLNLQASPKPTWAEAAHHIRSGAVVTGHYVLGQSGVANNPTDWITCVYPRSQNANHATLTLGQHTLTFKPLDDLVWIDLGHPLADDAYEPFLPYLRATPEKALLDLLYVATHTKHHIMPAVHDFSLADIDEEKIHRLATHMGLSEVWVTWRQGVQKAEQDVADSERRAFKR